MELVRSVRWNVDRFSSAHNTLLPAESSLQFTVEKNKCLLEIMTIRVRAASGRNVHINQGESTCSICSGQQDRVGVAHDSEMLCAAAIRVCNHQIPPRVVGRNLYRIAAVSSNSLSEPFSRIVFSLSTDLRKWSSDANL